MLYKQYRMVWCCGCADRRLLYQPACATLERLERWRRPGRCKGEELRAPVGWDVALSSALRYLADLCGGWMGRWRDCVDTAWGDLDADSFCARGLALGEVECSLSLQPASSSVACAPVLLNGEAMSLPCSK